MGEAVRIVMFDDYGTPGARKSFRFSDVNLYAPLAWEENQVDGWSTRMSRGADLRRRRYITLRNRYREPILNKLTCTLVPKWYRIDSIAQQ